jgi:hypothetical protein
MNNLVSSQMYVGSLSVAILITTLAIAITVLASLPGEDKYNVNAQVVDVDEPPTNATEELDVKVDATEPLPVNGTIIVDITDADDVDLNALPPEGVSIIVTNTTLTVTNHLVEISEEGASETSPPTDTEGFSTGPSIPNNENEVGEGSDNDGGDDDVGDDDDDDVGDDDDDDVGDDDDDDGDEVEG